MDFLNRKVHHTQKLGRVKIYINAKKNNIRDSFSYNNTSTESPNQ